MVFRNLRTGIIERLETPNQVYDPLSFLELHPIIRQERGAPLRHACGIILGVDPPLPIRALTARKQERCEKTQ
jgi:hypothetical protein